MRRELLPLLVELPAFSRLGEADLLALLEACRELQVRPGEQLITEGRRDQRVLILLRGELGVYRRDRGPDPIVRLRPVALVGLLAAVLDGKRTATVRATERSQLAVLRASSIELLSASQAPLGIALQTALTTQLLDDLRAQQAAYAEALR